MGKVMSGLTMSLDGFIAAPNDGPENPLGEGGMRLFDWYSSGDTEYVVPSGAMTFKVSKRSAEKDIAVQGSPTLVRSFLQNDLLDKLKPMIHPVVVGGGKRLFENGRAPKRLLLTDTKTTRTGVVILTYEPKDPR